MLLSSWDLFAFYIIVIFHSTFRQPVVSPNTLAWVMEMVLPKMGHGRCLLRPSRSLVLVVITRHVTWRREDVPMVRHGNTLFADATPGLAAANIVDKAPVTELAGTTCLLERFEARAHQWHLQTTSADARVDAVHQHVGYAVAVEHTPFAVELTETVEVEPIKGEHPRRRERRRGDSLGKLACVRVEPGLVVPASPRLEQPSQVLSHCFCTREDGTRVEDGPAGELRRIPTIAEKHRHVADA